ncbi:MAG: UvrD-helicase domain-containing protein [Acidimicrobiales bacterium]
MIADQHVRDAISSGALDRTLFVEAGAGTGKTSQLVGRITNLVIHAGVPLSEIAAITFTDAAATELRDRIRTEFEVRLAGAEAEGDPLAEQRCRAALADADLAAISTLHGFAQRILSEHPVQSGLPPRVGVLDEVGSTLEREERWERFVDSLHDDPANDELLLRAALLGIPLERSYDGQVTLQDLAVRLSDSWDRLAPVAAREHPALPPLDFSAFDRAVADIAALPAQCDDQTDKFLRKLVDELLPSMQAIADITDPATKLRALDGLRKDWGPGAGGRATAWGGDVKAAKAHVAAVNEARAEVLGAACHDVLDRLVTLIAADVLAAAESRRREGRLEFHDLLVFAERLLVHSPAARASLHRRYTRLLLDEFQDTDPLQIRLAALIASSVTGDTVGEWHEVDVDDGRLFFVGDPKQSIYRFRRADIDLFLRARDRFGSGDALQRLSTNFRTISPVIEWLNDIFGSLMPDEVPGMQPRYEALLAHRTPPPDADHRPVLLGGPHLDARAAEIRAAEASDVARLLTELRAAPHRWQVQVEGTKEWRPARLADVTILIPTRTELPALQLALDAVDIPFHLSTGTLVYDTQEVRDALAALRAVDDPSDELSLVAALRSPLYACSDVHLFEHHRAGGRWDLRRAVPDELGPDHPVADAMAHLRSLWERRWWSRASSLLAELLSDRRAFVSSFGSERPEESWSRLRFIIDQARHFEESNGGDLRAFLQWADLQRSETVTVHERVAPDGSDDVVQIMTIHGSKGLEFPIAVLSGMSAQPRRAVQGVSLLWDARGMPQVALSKRRAMLDHGPLTDVEQDMVAHEQVRLLYVAATRARDHLVVSTHHAVGKGSFAERVWAASQGTPESWRRSAPEEAREVSPDHVASTSAAVGSVSDGEAVVPIPDAAGRVAWLAERESLLDPQRESRVLSATAVAARASATDLPDDHLDTDDATSDRPTSVAPQRRRGRAGTAVGRAVHGVMQHVDLAEHTPATLSAEATRQCDLEAIPELVDTVVALAASALGSSAVSDAARSRHHREVYVAAPLGDRVLEGYVDLLVETPEGLVVVDYKTDAVRSDADVDAKLAGYELQAAAYAVALEASTGLSVARCRFVFCRTGGAIERDVSDLPGAMDRVRRAVAGGPASA